MKAIYFRQHGEADALEYGDLPPPEPKPGEALVKVRAVSLNHLDIWVRRGWPGLNLQLPHVGGSDIVGQIVSINGNSALTPGTRVYVNPGVVQGSDEWIARGEESLSPQYRIIGEHMPGGLAELVAVPLNNIFAAPETISDESLAARILVGVTCWRMLVTRGNLKAGEKVLVIGAGGGVNSLSIQLATALGAMVIAVAGTKEKCNRALSLGAKHAICYGDTPDWSRVVQKITPGSGVDVVVDNVGRATFPHSLRALKRGGRLLTVGNTSGFDLQIDNRLIFGKQLSIIGSTMGSRADLDAVLAFMSAHNIEPAIDTVAPLADGIKQLRRLEAGDHFGKIVLKP